MEWRTDIGAAPKGRTVQEMRKVGKNMATVDVFQPDHVILASKCGKVIKSHWLPVELPHRPVGRWQMFHTGEEPVAWMPWPEYPNAA
jgi:hypothetical protein